MTCPPSTEIGEQYVWSHEILLQLYLCEIFFPSLSSVKYPLLIQPLSQYTATNWMIFMFFIPDSSKKLYRTLMFCQAMLNLTLHIIF